MKRSAVLSAHTHEVLCLDADRGGTRILSGGEDGVCVWTAKGELVQKIVVGEGAEAVTSVCLARRDTNFFWASAANELFYIDLRNSKAAVASLKVNSDEINQITLNESGMYLAAADDSGEVRIIDALQQKLFKTLRKQHKNICSSVVFSPTKKEELYSGGLDNMICRWNFTAPRCIQKLDAMDEGAPKGLNPPMVHGLAVSADNTVAAALGDTTILLVSEKANGRLGARRIEGAHSFSISQVMFPAFDARGTLVSGGNDKRLCVHAREGDEWALRHTEAHPAKINWLASLPDRTVVVADCSPNISLYSVLS